MTEKFTNVSFDFDEECIILQENNSENYYDEKGLGDLLNEQEETIQELYDFRLIYNALLFNEWSKHDTIEVYKSKKHSDGELCFDGEWFVVVAILPTGQITNHYHIKYWDYFQIKEYPQVKDEFDGHTPIDVLNRLKKYGDVEWLKNIMKCGFYQENGFASTSYRIKSFKNKENAKEYAERMNKEDKDALYQVYEKEFDD